MKPVGRSSHCPTGFIVEISSATRRYSASAGVVPWRRRLPARKAAAPPIAAAPSQDELAEPEPPPTPVLGKVVGVSLPPDASSATQMSSAQWWPLSQSASFA